MNRSFDIRREVDIAAAPEEVWDAVATREGLRCWLWDQEVVPEGAARSVVEPPHRLFIELPRAENGATQSFEYVIEAAGGTTRLRFVHSGFLGDDWEGELDFQNLTGLGWDMYLHTLSEYLSNFRGRRATYVLADGPAPSAGPGARALLYRTLGLDEALAGGDPIHVRPEGLPPIDGTVDFASHGYLGVRTGDALYRFHFRSLIGLSIAVGHHLFGDVDAERAADAWKDWLEGVFNQPANRPAGG